MRATTLALHAERIDDVRCTLAQPLASADPAPMLAAWGRLSAALGAGWRWSILTG